MKTKRDYTKAIVWIGLSLVTIAIWTFILRNV